LTKEKISANLFYYLFRRRGKMDSIGRMEKIDRMKEVLDQTVKDLNTIKNDKRILEIEETLNPLENLCDSLDCINKTVKDAEQGGSLTINGLKLDAENFLQNAEILQNEVGKRKVNELSKLIVENLFSNSKRLLEICL
jgi:hypothetical protein